MDLTLSVSPSVENKMHPTHHDNPSDAVTHDFEYGEQDMLSYSMAFVVKKKKKSNNKLNLLKGTYYALFLFFFLGSSRIGFHA